MVVYLSYFILFPQGDSISPINNISAVKEPNQSPIILGLISDRNSPQKFGTTITWTANAVDLDGDKIFYKFFIDGKPQTNWSENSMWEWKTIDADVGEMSIGVQVRDGRHAGSSGSDDFKNTYFTITEAKSEPPTETPPAISESPEPKTTSPNPQIQYCEAFASQGEYSEAIQCYDELISLKPLDETLLLRKGNSLLFLGRSVEAITIFDKAINVNPNYALAWHSKAAALRDIGKTNDFLLAEEMAIKLDSNCAICWYGKSIALEDSGQHDAATKALEKAIQINRTAVLDALWHNGLANIYTGNYGKALAAFNQLLDIDPNSAKGWANKGVALSDLGRYVEANEAFEKAVGINPDMAVAWYDKGIVLQKLNLVDESNAAFSKAKYLGYSGPA